MIEIVEQEISLRIPDRYYFSFTNSPCYAHRKMSAVDIYSGGKEIVSPFSGKLVFYRDFHGEHISGFESDGKILRVLHLKPAMRLGEKFDTGDFLGHLQDSPTFLPWTDYHIHLEIRKSEDFIRAGNVKRLTISNSLSSRLKFVENALEGRVKEIKFGRYILLEMKEAGFTPVVIGNKDNYGFLEGGIPHYGHGGIIGEFRGENVIINGKIIGKKIERSGIYTHIKTSKIIFSMGDVNLRGISSYLNYPYLKVIPRSWNFEINTGERVKLRFQ